MGFFDGLLGNATNVDPSYVQDVISHIVLDDEYVQNSYVIFRDLIVFTDKRLIMVDKQGATGKKTSYKSVPYRNITHYTIETAGTFEIDATLTIHIFGADPIIQVFKRDGTIVEVQKALAVHIL